MVDVEIRGLDDITKALNKLPLEISGPMAREMLTRSILEIEQRVKFRSPVKTGRLWSSWAHRASSTEAVVGTNVEYAKALEESNKRPRRRGTIPFLAPAFRDAKPAIEGHIKDTGEAIIAFWEQSW